MLRKICRISLISCLACCILFTGCDKQTVESQTSEETYGYEFGNYYVADHDGFITIYHLIEKNGIPVLEELNGDIISEFKTEEGIVQTVYEALHDMKAYVYETEWNGTEAPVIDETYGYEIGKFYAINSNNHYEVYLLEQENGRPYLLTKDGLKIVLVNRAGTDVVFNVYEYLNEYNAFECDESYYK